MHPVHGDVSKHRAVHPNDPIAHFPAKYPGFHEREIASNSCNRVVSHVYVMVSNFPCLACISIIYKSQHASLYGPCVVLCCVALRCVAAPPNVGRKTTGMCKSGICDTKPAISLKRSSLEPKLLQSVYRNSCRAYRLVINLKA